MRRWFNRRVKTVTEDSLPLLPGVRDHDAPRTEPLDLHGLDSYPRVVAAYFAPSLSRIEERLFVFGFLIARRPERVLEIGFRYGGMAYVILNAMEDSGQGRLVSVDPAPQPALDFGSLNRRFTLVRGPSPDALPRACELLGGPIDICFIDGDHAEAAVTADLDGVLPLMANDSYILLHDPYRPDVSRATEMFLARHGPRVLDCGYPCPLKGDEDWSGLRLLRVVTPLSDRSPPPPNELR